MKSTSNWFQDYIEEHKDDPNFVCAQITVSLQRTIYERMKELSISDVVLAQKMNITVKYFKDLMNHLDRASIYNISKIGKYLGLKLKINFTKRK
jgi:stalled ribosome rescue protein Dom34